MAERAVISVSSTPEISERLSKLAAATRRSKSYLANEAIERYLREEEDFVASINRGLAQADAGEGMTTEEMLSKLKARIDKRAAKSRV